MKKVSYIIMVISATLLVVLNCVACLDYRDKAELESCSASCEQSDSFFPDDEQRYILVDESTQKLGDLDTHCYIYADKYTNVMYGYYVSGGYHDRAVVMIQLEHEDGSPMLFDDEVW